MEEDVVIIPVKKKDLNVISPKTMAIGVGIGLALALTLGAILITKNNVKTT